MLYIPDFVDSIPANAFNLNAYNANRAMENRENENLVRTTRVRNLFIHKGIKKIEAGAFEQLKNCNLYFEEGCPIEDYESNDNFSWVETSCKMFFNCKVPINPEAYESKESELKLKYPDLYEIQQKLTIFLDI